MTSQSKLSLNRKKVIVRIFFYSIIFLIFALIPIIYKRFFMTCGIGMLIFFLPFYLLWELILIIGLVFLAEYYLFVKLIKIKIENEKLRIKTVYLVTILSIILVFGSRCLLLD